MKCPKILFMLALVVTFSTSFAEEEFLLGNDDEDVETLETSDIPFNLPETLEPTSLRGTSRFLAQTPPRARLTCDKYPRVCRAKGSTGPDCCKTKCVDVKTDRLNCGMCGKKCKYSEICCKGKCVNPWNDNKHCGSCNNKCKKGRSCVYGMCSYA